MREIEQLPEAYSGKYVEIKNKTYTLVPEQVKKGCKDCAFVNKLDCTSTRTDYCRQGYVFKKVNV